MTLESSYSYAYRKFISGWIARPYWINELRQLRHDLLQSGYSVEKIEQVEQTICHEEQFQWKPLDQEIV